MSFDTQFTFSVTILVLIIYKTVKTDFVFSCRSGGFGSCFIPDTLREPTKKLYAARPGLRVWTADESGKVSSTSVFKSLLADKPPVIRTLSGNDTKFNSSGQFGKLLTFYNQYVITWDANRIWVLDLDLGNVIGCHSNLGKIRDVAVCGHEVFVLVNQRERFLRRFILTTERVLDSSCLDAVIAGSEDAGEAETEEGAEKSGFSLASALMNVPFMALEVLRLLLTPTCTRKNLGSCSKSANKPSTGCVRTACPKLSTSLEQAVNNL